MVSMGGPLNFPSFEFYFSGIQVYLPGIQLYFPGILVYLLDNAMDFHGILLEFPGI